MDEKKISTDIYEVLDSRKWNLTDDGLYTLFMPGAYCYDLEKEQMTEMLNSPDPCDRFYDKLYDIHSDDEWDFQVDIQSIVRRALMDKYGRRLENDEDDLITKAVKDIVMFEPPFDAYKKMKCVADITLTGGTYRVSLLLMDLVNLAYIIRNKSSIKEGLDKQALILPLSKGYKHRIGKVYSTLENILKVEYVGRIKQSRKCNKPCVILPDEWTVGLLELEKGADDDNNGNVQTGSEET